MDYHFLTEIQQKCMSKHYSKPMYFEIHKHVNRELTMTYRLDIPDIMRELNLSMLTYIS